MLGANAIYKHMNQVSQRYDRLKKLFEEFGDHAKAVLNGENGSVQGVQFESEYQNDRFCVRFAGKCVRFAFSADLGTNGSEHAFVRCSLVDPVTKAVGTAVESFSFNSQGDTKLKLPLAEEVIKVNTKDDAAYLILHMLNESLGKQ